MIGTETRSTPMTSVRTLLSGAIDYAGLFPPSALSMPEAVINYATYRTSNYNWMLGRFVLTAERLDEFYEAARDFISRDGKSVWQLAVVAGEDIVDTIRRVKAFNQNAKGAVGDVLEVRANSDSKIINTVTGLPDNVTAYFELPLDERLADLVATL